ncbi:MAG: endonuclease MutS2, partial [Terriglobales bacterium]
EIDFEIARILQELSALAKKHLSELQSSFEAAVELDLIVARARLALRYGGHMPQLSEDRRFHFKNARHPLLVLQSSVSNVVPNDIQLGGEDGNTLVITGPNTGGKTVLLKTVGIFALMVRCGLLPAAQPGSAAALFPIVCADIGDEQSLEQSLSTFSSHMQNIVEIVNNARDGMLVLIDEAGAGTDPREGAALARAVLEALNESGAVTIATTHYGELKTLAYTESGFVNGSLDFDDATLSPTYRLRLGVPGASKATTIAQRLGLKRELVERARSLMASSEQDLQKTIERLEEKLKELDTREQAAQEALHSAQQIEEEARKQLASLEKQSETRRKELAGEIEEEF